jgi:antirestriction protein ArdC
MTTDLYATVTASILAQLEAGAAPWVKPWSGRAVGGTMPRNASTGRAYSGVNVPLLWMAQDAGGYASPRWLTFKQALDAGGNVRKGEKGSMVVFVSAIERTEENANGEEESRRIPFLKRYTVFNVAQCDGLPAAMVAGELVEPKSQAERVELADEFLTATGATIREGFGEAYYRPGDDFISLPAFASFKSADHFYATAFHELGHWTGHKSRLARDLSGRFGNQAYAAEELIAELCAAFLSAEFGLDGDLRHAGYIESWIKLLKSDNRAFFTAAAKAQQAADHLRGLALAEPVAIAA